MTIEEAKNLEQFVCSECSSDDDVKKTQNGFTASPGADSKVHSHNLRCIDLSNLFPYANWLHL